VEELETEYLANPFLEKEALAIFFGDGGVGKSYVGLGLALALGHGGDFLGYSMWGGIRTLYLDYERNKKTFDQRLKRLRQPLGITHEEVCKYIFYKNMANAPVHARIKDLKAIIKRDGIELLIVDSALGASGGKPEDPDCTRQLCQALKSLKITCLLIAHITKSGDQLKPFGSAYWHNEPSNTWNIQSKEDDDNSNIKHIGIFHRKHNTGPAQPAIGAKMEFSAPGSQQPSFTKIEREQPVNFDEETKPNERILQLIGTGPQTNKSIQEATGIKPNTIRSAVKRLNAKNKITKIGDEWWLADGQSSKKPEP
jgi:hypothetical protein